MTETERIALTAAFLTAVVVAGLSLSYVPHVELVTLTVFASGILLGSSRGALVGAVGMSLYVFANSALKGFPPSPLPVLAAQALGMMLPGLVGGWWRRFWLRSGVPSRSAFGLLPVLGVLLAGLNQGLLNLAYVMILSDAVEPRTAMFLSGMAFGLMDMLWNGVFFALGGPVVASVLRRTARKRGWWGSKSVGLLIALGIGLTPALPAGAQTEAPRDTVYGAPDRVSPADSLETESDSVDTTEVVRPSYRTPGLEPLDQAPNPIWKPFPTARATVLGLPSLIATNAIDAAELSRNTPTSVPITLERWGMGWGRSRFSFDGIPLRGPIHGFEEPPDVPLAWRGIWKQKWTGSGTSINIPSPGPPQGAPLSQISLTTGSQSRRTSEFALFRNLGPVDVGIDFMDRQGQGRTQIDEVTRIKTDRLWIHLRPVRGKRPEWTLDLSVSNETRSLGNSDVYFSGAEMGRDVRRAQGSIRGPFLGGETRLVGQVRRQAIQTERMLDAFGEVIFDGYTLQADWAARFVPGLNLSGRYEFDRRRGELPDEASFQGVYGLGRWSGTWGILSLGADGKLGHQEPYGFTWEGTALAEIISGAWSGQASLSREEDLPSMVVGLDRPSPESGMFDHLDIYETAENPEARSALRIEGTYGGSALLLSLGGWAAWHRNYLPESNPVWSIFSGYQPSPPPARNANIHGGYGLARVQILRGVFAEGKGRIHDRPLVDVPYMSRWIVEGALHWRRRWFRGSLLLDAAIGGKMIGPRRNPDGEEYLSAGVGFIELLGRVDNGVVTLTFENLVDNFVEADLRRSDAVTPISMSGRTINVGLTMYLTN